jgi:hypothetical protein
MISDEQLLLYHYDDGLDANERTVIGRALSEDGTLRTRLLNLVNELDAAEPPTIPVPRDAQQRWRNTLNALASASKHVDQKKTAIYTPAFLRRAGFAAAAMALVSVVIGLSFLRTRSDTGEPVSTNVAAANKPVSDADVERFERSLRWHLIETEQQLATFDQLNPEERSPMFEKLLVQNQLYVSAAERVDGFRYARALRGFAPVIERISHGNASPTEVDAGLAQLHFELKVIQARLGSHIRQMRVV